MKSFTLRNATKKDSASLLRLIDALADYEKLKRPSPAARKRLIRDAFGKEKRFHVFLAFVDGTPVGYAIYFFTYSSFLALPTLYLEDLFVLPEFRKNKIGLSLFGACLKEAKKKSCGRMEWMVLDWNTPSIDFFDRLGAAHLKAWFPYRIEQQKFGPILKSISAK